MDEYLRATTESSDTEHNSCRSRLRLNRMVPVGERAVPRHGNAELHSCDRDGELLRVALKFDVTEPSVAGEGSHGVSHWDLCVYASEDHYSADDLARVRDTHEIDSAPDRRFMGTLTAVEVAI